MKKLKIATFILGGLSIACLISSLIWSSVLNSDSYQWAYLDYEIRGSEENAENLLVGSILGLFITSALTSAYFVAHYEWDLRIVVPILFSLSGLIASVAGNPPVTAMFISLAALFLILNRPSEESEARERRKKN
ncbi:MAG TPA: hypothetical protein VJ103_02800 [Candidatus Paceibacterota bacterium]|nr:hypothetical protein [Candidatus Paceibacterota bacterium]